MMKKTVLLLLSLWLVLGSTCAAREIVVTSAGRQTIPLALTAPLPLTGRDRLVQHNIQQLLRADLDLSGLFDFTAENAFLDDADHLGLTSVAVNFAQWRMLGAQLLIKGAYQLDGERLLVKLRLFDVISRRMLTGHNYRGRVKDVRRMVHSFADQVMAAVTGKAGCFNTRIAFISDNSGHKELYLAESDGYNPQRITNHGNLVLNPDFAPNGRELLFTSYKRGNPDLYRKQLYGGHETLVAHYKGLNIAGRYRPDGGELAATLSRDGNAEVYLLGTDGRIHQRLTNAWGIDVDPSWNPDGDRIAFVSNRQGNPNIYIVDILTARVSRLTYTGKYNATPAWSPDGKRIAFSRLENGTFNLYSIAADGSDERQLTFGAGNKEHPRWSPDGRFIIYSNDISGKKQIYVMRADGSGHRRISRLNANCSHPAWSRRW